MGITAKTLKTIAQKLCNYDAYQLIDAGVLVADSKGRPAVGGSDWNRFCDDTLMFIIKLPEDRLENLAKLLERDYTT
jgi:hypothetical protein